MSWSEEKKRGGEEYGGSLEVRPRSTTAKGRLSSLRVVLGAESLGGGSDDLLVHGHGGALRVRARRFALWDPWMGWDGRMDGWDRTGWALANS